MARYEVTTLQLARCTYIVEADSMEQAIQNVNPTRDTLIDQYVLDEIAGDYGMSFDEAQALGVDPEIIRTKYNGNNNHDHVEGIAQIKEVK